MQHKFIFLGAVLAGLAVVLGAFGAHFLQPHLAILVIDIKKTQPMQVFRTGVEYQFYHAFALLITGILYKYKPTPLMQSAGNLFLVGVLLFSGSLYVISFGYLNHLNLGFLGAVTPLGGIAFIIGWALLAYSFASPKMH